jgi:hypothetical protein
LTADRSHRKTLSRSTGSSSAGLEVEDVTRPPSVFWRYFLIAGAILTLLLSVAIWKELQRELNPPKPTTVRPAPQKPADPVEKMTAIQFFEAQSQNPVAGDDRWKGKRMSRAFESAQEVANRCFVQQRSWHVPTEARNGSASRGDKAGKNDISVARWYAATVQG